MSVPPSPNGGTWVRRVRPCALRCVRGAFAVLALRLVLVSVPASAMRPIAPSSAAAAPRLHVGGTNGPLATSEAALVVVAEVARVDELRTPETKAPHPQGARPAADGEGSPPAPAGGMPAGRAVSLNRSVGVLADHALAPPRGP